MKAKFKGAKMTLNIAPGTTLLIERAHRCADGFLLDPIKGYPCAWCGAVGPDAAPVMVKLADVLAIVEPFALNAWGGDVVLKKLRALGNNDAQKERTNAATD